MICKLDFTIHNYFELKLKNQEYGLYDPKKKNLNDPFCSTDRPKGATIFWTK